MSTFQRATYSPEDNKLRLYATSRLDSDTYAKVKAAGFKWAPKQDVFVAPMWTPEREDLLIELAGEVGDEDTSLVDRAEERAERFTEYREKRTTEANQAQETARQISERFSGGQPILVGHHSERKARKDQEKMDNHLRKTIKLWETASYWKSRAAGAVRYAKYKELPRVRARRMKGIQADKRKQERTIAENERLLKMWTTLEDGSKWIRKDGQPATMLERAKHIANHSFISRCFTLEQFPRPEGCTSNYEGSMGLWSALDAGIITAEQAKDISLPSHAATIERAKRWVQHCENRLTYETAMLAEQGAEDLLKPKPKPKPLPLCNYRQAIISVKNRWNAGEMMNLPQVEMTQAEYAEIYRDYKGTEEVENSHRVRVAIVKHQRIAVFLTDSKIHAKPQPSVSPEPTPPAPVTSRPTYEIPHEQKKAQELQAALNMAKQFVVVPALFPTPPALAAKMVEMASLEAGQGSLTVLEPSAGVGSLIAPIYNPDVRLTAVEIHRTLADALRQKWPAVDVRTADFLACNGDLGLFDRIIMNPPFTNAIDIAHICHAITFLKPGGKLVAVCANGPRQREALKPLASYWEDLPEDTFKDAGTQARTALLIIEA